MELTGVYVPIVTTFNPSGDVDLDSCARTVRAMLAAGVHGIVVAGTTGEGYTLSLSERDELLRAVRHEVAGSVPILAGVGGMSTREALEQANLAHQLAFDGLMVAAPAYCLPTQAELAEHVTSIVRTTGMPTVLYDYPQRTGVSFNIECLDALAPLAEIVGIKEASGDLSRITVLTERYGADLPVICGADAESPRFLDSGVTCWIGGIANLIPAAHVAMMDPILRPEVHKAVLPLLRYIEQGRYISKVKSGMGLRGLPQGAPRTPLHELSASEIVELEAALDSAGIWAPSLAS